MQKRVAIIGGGACGLVSAILIARALGKSVQVEILERCDRVGRKLLATGNGRCNITNANIQIANYHSVGRGCESAIESILRRFDNDSAMRFFEDLGAQFLELEDGKIYPASLQASSILDLLRHEARRLGVKETINCNVTGIMPMNEAGAYHESLGAKDRDRRSLSDAGEYRESLGNAGENRKNLLNADRDFRASVNAGEYHENLGAKDRDRRSLSDAGEYRESLGNAGENHKYSGAKDRDRRSLSDAGEYRESLGNAGENHKNLGDKGRDRSSLSNAGEFRKSSGEAGAYRIQIEGADPIIADCVLVAAGGEASPQLGSNGSGYKLLEKFGHKSTRRYAAIVPLETDTSQIKALKGIKFIGEAEIISGGKTLRSNFGEILFTEYGLSGPPILQLSSALIAGGSDGANRNSWIILRLFPEKEKEVMLSKLFLRRSSLSHLKLEDYFLGWLNKRIGQSLFRVCGISDLQRLSGSLTDGEIVSLSEMMVAWPIRIKGARPFSQAQVTAGGFSLKEFSAGLESRFSPGLFAAGEILDVHGDCGGYNLQWAWSSAHTAASAMIKRLKKV